MKKILIVEDNDSLREEICDWFAFEGFSTLSASNGSLGLQLAKDNRPDIILCDILMPEMDGMEMLNQVRMHPSTSLIPFVFMTALSERTQVRSGMELGAHDYIPKPFTRLELLNAVYAQLSKVELINTKAKNDMDSLRNSIAMSLPHELRTPLNAILGYGEVLQSNSEIMSVDLLQSIGLDIYESGERLYRLIKNYLLYAQLELRKPDNHNYSSIDKPGLIVETVAKEKALKYKRGGDLYVEITDGPVKINKEEFEKAIEELVDNAFKFSSVGTPVRLSTQVNVHHFIVCIEDQGIGMTKDEIGSIGAYMQFQRGKFEQQGSGLGLIISKKIIEYYHGEMVVDSISGQGTIIKVLLPC